MKKGGGSNALPIMKMANGLGNTIPGYQQMSPDQFKDAMSSAFYHGPNCPHAK